MGTPGFIPDPKDPKFCPKGHPTGTSFEGQRCNTRKCGEDKLREKKLHINKGALDLDSLSKVDPKDAAHEQRMELVNKPRGLKAEDARGWAEGKLQELLPEAVANIAWDLRYGEQRARSEATDRVLRANGMDKREAGNVGQGGMIVLNIGTGGGGADMKIPWLQRVSKPVVASKAGKDDDESD